MASLKVCINIVCLRFKLNYYVLAGRADLLAGPLRVHGCPRAGFETSRAREETPKSGGNYG